jgi:hypothetical protein
MEDENGRSLEMSGALVRFWWVVFLGVLVGVSVAAWMVYALPSLTPREEPVYSAAARLFVTSAEGQYVRLSVPTPVETPGGGGGGGGPDSNLVIVDETPDFQPLLAAANLYPSLIESDQVAELREERYGLFQGDVFATAYTAVSTPQRFLAAQLPLIDIVATSPTAREAMALAQATADTFGIWIKREQDRAGVAPEDRILIQQLRAPSDAFPTGGPTFGLPILAAIAIAAAFVIIAVVLDQLFPRDATARRLQSETT